MRSRGEAGFVRSQVCEKPEVANLAEKLKGMGVLSFPLGKEKEKDKYHFSLFPMGIPKGAITEVCGHGKTGLILQFLAENSRSRVAWVEQSINVYPRVFPRWGVALERVLFIEAGEHLLWVLSSVLRSQLFQILVVHLGFEMLRWDLKSLRRLQLGAEQSGVSLFLLSPESRRKGNWPISLQLQVQGERKIHVLRNRFSSKTVLEEFKQEGGMQ